MNSRIYRSALFLGTTCFLGATLSAQTNLIQSTGNVGIGTTTPGSDVNMTGGLTINGTSSTQLTVQQNNVSGFALNVGQAGAGAWTMFDKVGGNWISSITSSGGKVGIGTTNPQYPLDVSGSIALKGRLAFDSTTISTPSDGTFVIASGGRIHGEYIVTFEAPFRAQTVHLLLDANQFDGASTLQVLENHSLYNANAVMGNFRLLWSPDHSTIYLVMDVANRSGGTSALVQYQGGAGYASALGGTLSGNETSMPWILGMTSIEGNVGIGTITPGAKLEVSGNIKLSSGTGASISFPDNTVQSTAWSGTLCGGDYAESVNPVGTKASYEPGDVLIISEGTTGDVTKSTESYSTLVAGIYSTKPGVLGRRQTGEGRDAEIPMAMVGIVPTKVSAENGSIKKGDLLVTASIPGYAMKGTDRSRMLGAVVGKALGTLDSGTGVIEVLVTLQ